MIDFIVYDLNGKILRPGHCQNRDFLLQGGEDEFVMEGQANDVTQKIEFDGLDDENQPINPKIVNKTPEEIEQDNPTPPPVPPGEQPAHITNEQWQDVLKRLDKLEAEA